MKTINSGDFAKQVAEDCGLSFAQVKKVLDAAGARLKQNVKEETEMHFIGYFNIGIKAKKAGVKLNPFTGEKIKVAACKVPTIKLSASFKQLLKKK